MSIDDIRTWRAVSRLFPEVDTVTLAQWRARMAAGPAPIPARIDTRPVCPTCGNRYTRKSAPRHDYCSRLCRLRWQAAHRQETR